MNEKGKKGEFLAARYLEEKGYSVIARNYHSRYGEIDLICQKDSFLIFVEVKERKTSSFVSPLEAVTVKKQGKLILTAQQYLIKENVPSYLQPRFDVVAVLESGKEQYSFCHIENAFGKGGWR